MMTPMERRLKLQTEDGFVDVVVMIFWPELRDGSWVSDWTIVWPDRESKLSAGGSDAIQALLCAVNLVGAQLNCSAEHQAGQLSWGGDWIGLGFPVPNNMRDLLVGDDARYL